MQRTDFLPQRPAVIPFITHHDGVLQVFQKLWSDCHVTHVSSRQLHGAASFPRTFTTMWILVLSPPRDLPKALSFGLPGPLACWWTLQWVLSMNTASDVSPMIIRSCRNSKKPALERRLKY